MRDTNLVRERGIKQDVRMARSSERIKTGGANQNPVSQNVACEIFSKSYGEFVWTNPTVVELVVDGDAIVFVEDSLLIPIGKK